MKSPPRLIVFDVIETMFSLEPTRTAMTSAGLSPESLELWFARMLRDAFAITAAGGYAPFEKVATGALGPLLADRDDAEAVSARILGSLTELGAHGDVRPALQACADAGVPVVALSNGTAAGTQGLLERSGLAPLVRRVLSVHDVGSYKPHSSVYAAARGQDVAPHEAALVAVHGWDIYGARQAGLMTGWCSRLERVLSPALGPADVEGDDLCAVVDGLLRT